MTEQQRCKKNSKAHAACMLCMVLLFLMLALSAQASAVVSLTLLSEPDVAMRRFDALIEVTIHDTDYIREGLFLSYHVYEKEEDIVETESLRYENTRIPLSLNAQGSETVSIPVDLSEFKQDTVFVQYDIVDTVELFWFASNSELTFSGAGTVFNGTWWNSLIAPLKTAITRTPGLLVMNLIVFAAAIFLTRMIIRRKLFKF